MEKTNTKIKGRCVHCGKKVEDWAEICEKCFQREIHG